MNSDSQVNRRKTNLLQSILRLPFKLACRKWLFVITVTITFASLMYWVNNTGFYSSQRAQTHVNAYQYAQTIELFANATANHADQKQLLTEYLNTISGRGLIKVSKTDKQGQTLWQIDTENNVDTQRTVLRHSHAFSDGDNADINLDFTFYIASPFYLQLARAWSWSILDLIQSPENYFKYRIWMRSAPLYGYAAILFLCSLFLISLQQRMAKAELEHQLSTKEVFIDKILSEKENLKKEYNRSRETQKEFDEIYNQTDSENEKLKLVMEQQSKKIERIQGLLNIKDQQLNKLLKLTDFLNIDLCGDQ